MFKKLLFLNIYWQMQKKTTGIIYGHRKYYTQLVYSRGRERERAQLSECINVLFAAAAGNWRRNQMLPARRRLAYRNDDGVTNIIRAAKKCNVDYQRISHQSRPEK